MKIEHSLKFVTEFAEGHPITMRMSALPKEMQTAMLEGMLKDLVAPALKPILDEINKNGSYAILKVVE